MLVSVHNRAAGPRGLATLDRGVVVLEGGETALLDLADHPSHDAWCQGGDIRVTALSDRDARAARRRFEGEAQARHAGQAEALAALPQASPAMG